jgi:hypothetical protein
LATTQTENDIPSKWNAKASRSSYTHSDKAGLKPKLVRRDKEGHYVLIKGIIHQENITIINIFSSNVGESNFI